MKTLYAITPSPLFYRTERHYRLSQLERNRLEWDEHKRSEVTYLLVQAVQGLMAKEPRPLSLPVSILITVWEESGPTTDERSLRLHLEKIENLEKRGYEFDE